MGLGRGMDNRASRPLAAAVIALSMAAPAAAEPAMWVARDADSTVYLLGTIHLLDGTRTWLTPPIAEAFAASSELWLEIDVLEDRTAGFYALAAAGTSADRSLARRLTPEEKADMDRLAAAAGIPIQTLEPLRPWLASVTLTVEHARKAGLDAKGADLTLAEMARDAGKPTFGFETAGDQLKTFGSLAPDSELALLRQTLADLDEGPALFHELVDSWFEGDVGRMVGTTRDSIEAAGPEVRSKLLVDRNRRFADRVASLMAGAGTQFVAVGAAHLVGEDSVLTMLAERGIATERVTGQEARPGDSR